MENGKRKTKKRIKKAGGRRETDHPRLHACMHDAPGIPTAPSFQDKIKGLEPNRKTHERTQENQNQKERKKKIAWEDQTSIRTSTLLSTSIIIIVLEGLEGGRLPCRKLLGEALGKTGEPSPIKPLVFCGTLPGTSLITMMG